MNNPLTGHGLRHFASNRATLLLVGLIFLAGIPVNAEETPADHQALHLSPELSTLLRDEMRAILGGVQTLVEGIASADWKSVADTASLISASYILDQKLTRAQRHELGHALPEHFKRLDADFHQQAEKLAAAAASHDAQLTVFHYSRLVEACTGCHALYAPSRFPGFTPAMKHGHGH